jgi:hypothetical protein
VKATRAFVFLAVWVLMAGCHRKEPTGSETDERRIAGDQEYSFVMEKSRQKELVALMPQVRLGSSSGEATSLLGAPTRTQALADKQTGTLKFTVLSYYFSVYKSGVAGDKDKYVALFFDGNDRLRSVFSNVEGIPSRDHPPQ